MRYQDQLRDLVAAGQRRRYLTRALRRAVLTVTDAIARAAEPGDTYVIGDRLYKVWEIADGRRLLAVDGDDGVWRALGPAGSALGGLERASPRDWLRAADDLGALLRAALDDQEMQQEAARQALAAVLRLLSGLAGTEVDDDCL